MKTFHVYHHPARGFEAVQEGACLPALCFSVFWLVYRGLSVQAAVVLLGGAFLVGAESTAGRNSVDAVQAWAFRSLMVAGASALWLLPCLYGNRWRHADLLRRGFAHITCLPAPSARDAVALTVSTDPIARLPEAAAGMRPPTLPPARARSAGADAPAGRAGFAKPAAAVGKAEMREQAAHVAADRLPPRERRASAASRDRPYPAK